jgi:hypothetical protein
MMVASIGEGKPGPKSLRDSHPEQATYSSPKILSLTPEGTPGAHLISRATAALVHTFAPLLLWQCHDRGNRT